MSSVKFVSKNSNYMVVLTPGIEGNRALGTHAISGLYVKFQAGVVDVKDEKVIKMLREHPSCGIDFLEVKENELNPDPYADEREEIEPDHVIQNIKYGHAEGIIGSKKKLKLTPSMKKVIENEAIRMLPNLLKQNPKILKDIIVNLAAEMKQNEATTNEPNEPKAGAKKDVEKPKANVLD